MNTHEWVLLAQAVGVIAAGAVLVLLVRGRVSREALVAAIALIVVALGVFGVATGVRTNFTSFDGVRKSWTTDDAARAKCIADASDQQWAPVVDAAKARLREGDHYAVVGAASIDVACLQLQLLPALGVEPEDRRAGLLIAMGPVPDEYRNLPSQRVGQGALLERR